MKTGIGLREAAANEVADEDDDFVDDEPDEGPEANELIEGTEPELRGTVEAAACWLSNEFNNDD